MKTLIDTQDLIFNPPELGTVLYLPGLPGAGNKIYDRSPYGNVGTITGATWKRLPSGLWYLSFDGVDDLVNLGVATSCRLQTFTLKQWVKRSSLGNIGLDTIISYGYQVTPRLGGWGLYLYEQNSANSNKLIFGSHGVSEIVSTFVITDITDWHHIVLVYDGSTAVFYLDKTSDSQSYSATFNFTQNLAVGASIKDGVPEGFFPGIIALPEVHNGLWTAFDVQNSFHQEKHLFGVW